jgi:hypothetical protein
VPGHDLLIEIQNLCLQRLGSESEQTGARNLGQPSVACIGYHIEQLFNTITSDRCDNAKLCKMRTDRIDRCGLLANEQMAGAMEHQAALLGVS